VKTKEQQAKRIKTLYFQDNRGPQKIHKMTGIPYKKVVEILRKTGVNVAY